MRRTPLTRGQATLVMVGLTTFALMGVPGFGHYEAPEGAIGGIVRDENGLGLAEVEVSLFSDESLELVELTTTDARGRFAFGQPLERYHVFARLPDDPRWVGAWRLSGQLGPEGTELLLARGHEVFVRVRDEEGMPVPFSEVRVHRVDPNCAVLARATTNAKGVVRTYLPDRAHVYVKPQHEGPELLASVWKLDVEAGELDGELAITIPRAEWVRGKISSDSEPVSGILLAAFDAEERFLAWTTSNEDGSFELGLPTQQARLLVADPAGAYLPLEVVVEAGREPIELALLRGRERRLTLGRPGAPITGRIWIRDEETGTWDLSRWTDRDGVLEARVGERYSVFAVPSREPGPLEAWNLSARQRELQLFGPGTE